jgi:hypothetical protein
VKTGSQEAVSSVDEVDDGRSIEMGREAHYVLDVN